MPKTGEVEITINIVYNVNLSWMEAIKLRLAGADARKQIVSELGKIIAKNNAKNSDK